MEEGKKEGREGGLRSQKRGKIGEGSQKVQTSSYKISKSWVCNVQQGEQGDYS